MVFYFKEKKVRFEFHLGATSELLRIGKIKDRKKKEERMQQPQVKEETKKKLPNFNLDVTKIP